MANVNQVSPDGGTTLYDIEDTPVRSSIARIEDGTSPSATINADEEFYHLNVLYKATQDIATTDTITPNSNCEVSPSITSQIAQKADISSLGTSAYKNSTSVVTDSTDLVESGAVKDIVGWGNKNLLPITLDRLKALNTAGTWSGNVYNLNNVTFEIQTSNNEVTAIKLSANNASANTNLIINALANPYEIGDGNDITYTVNLFPTTFALQVDVYENGEYKSTIQSRAEDQTKTYSGNITIGVARIRVFANATISETLIYPQLEKGSTATAYEPYHASVEESLAEKCDNSVIAPVENGTTASQAYAVGSHAIRNGAFITWKNAKAQGETINDASDYTSGDVADELTTVVSSVTTNNAKITLDSSKNFVLKRNSVLFFEVELTISGAITANETLFTLPFLPYTSPTMSIRVPMYTYNRSFVDLVYLNSSGEIHSYTGTNISAGTYILEGTFIAK